MKSFFSTFAAILAAAAVIWAIAEYRQSLRNSEAQAAAVVEGIQLMTDEVRMNTHMLLTQNNADTWDTEERKRDLDGAKTNMEMIAGLWRLNPRRHQRITELSRSLFFATREFTAAVRAKFPDENPVADDVDRAVERTAALVGVAPNATP